VSWCVGEVLEVSAFKEIGSPSCDGLVLLVSRAVSRRVFLFCKIEPEYSSVEVERNEYLLKGPCL
jgi:hypothetical protein